MADDPSQSVADPIASDPNIIPPAESASTPVDRPVSTILADSPTEPKTPLADPGSDYTVPVPVPADPPISPPVSPQSPPSPVSPTEEPSVPSVPSEPSAPSSPPEATSGGSIQDSLPPYQPSQVQPEAPESASSPQAFQTTEKAPQSAGIKPEPPQSTQEAPLADSDSQKTSFGDLTSDQPKPISPPVSPQLPQSPQAPISSPSAPAPSFGDLIGKSSAEEPTINIVPIEPPKPMQPLQTPISPPSPQSPLLAEAPAKEGISPVSPQTLTEKVIEAKADFSSQRQQALQTRRKKRDDHLTKIITLIDQKGKVSNKDVRDTLRVSQSTASDYLHSLVKDGKIKKEGKAKATIYLL